MNQKIIDNLCVTAVFTMAIGLGWVLGYIVRGAVEEEKRINEEYGVTPGYTEIKIDRR